MHLNIVSAFKQIHYTLCLVQVLMLNREVSKTPRSRRCNAEKATIATRFVLELGKDVADKEA